MKLLTVNDALKGFKKLNLDKNSTSYSILVSEILELNSLIGTKEDYERLKEYLMENFQILKNNEILVNPMHNFFMEYTTKFLKEFERWQIAEITDALNMRLKIKKDKPILEPLTSMLSILKANKGNKSCKEFLISLINELFKDDEESLNTYLIEIKYYANYYKSKSESKTLSGFKIISKLYEEENKYYVLNKVDSLPEPIKYMFYKNHSHTIKDPFVKLLFRIRATIAYRKI